VMWNFEQLGAISISHEEIKDKHIGYEDLELELIDQEINDFSKEDEGITIYTDVKDLQKIKDFLENDKKLKVESFFFTFFTILGRLISHLPQVGQEIISG